MSSTKINILQLNLKMIMQYLNIQDTVNLLRSSMLKLEKGERQKLMYTQRLANEAFSVLSRPLARENFKLRRKINNLLENRDFLNIEILNLSKQIRHMKMKRKKSSTNTL